MIYTVPLALQDFMPVILSAIGMYLLAVRVRSIDAPSGSLALLGAALITVGGLSKAVWKLEMATTGANIALLANSLFVFLAPGYTLIAWAMTTVNRAQRGQPKHNPVWRVPLLVIVGTAALSVTLAFVAPQGRSWSMVLTMVSAVGNIALCVMVIRQALRGGLRPPALFFALNLFVTFLMVGMVGIPHTPALQWGEQILNTLTQAAFAYAAWRLAVPHQRLVVSTEGSAD